MTEQLFWADLEYKFQTANRINQNDDECASYLIVNRERLLPKLIKKSQIEQKDVDDVIAEFSRSIHERHTSGLSLD